jgi:DNA-binding NarL/FixJ family response regulator
MRTALSLASNGDPTVLIGDDHPGILQTVSDLISPHFKVVATANDGLATLHLAEKTNPSLVVLDVNMPKLDGLNTARELARRNPSSKVVFLTSREDDAYISEALKAGARGYVVKRRVHPDILRALNLALNEQFFISPHAFSGVPRPQNNEHILHFYSNDLSFYQHAAELTYEALKNDELVFMFLSKAGVSFVREELRDRGLDYTSAILRGRYWVFIVENAFSPLPGDDSRDIVRIHALLHACLKRATARSQNTGARLTIFSDLMPTLLKQGCGYAVAARIEAVWNDLLPKQACTVYCGCPVAHLGAKASRETLSRLCCDHGDVIALDR